VEPMMTKAAAGELVRTARVRAGLTWAEIAAHVDKPLVWTTAALLGQHPVPLCPQGRARAVAHAEGGEDPGQVRLHRLLADAEAPADALVRQAGRDQRQHFALARREPVGGSCRLSAALGQQRGRGSRRQR